jgi:hypothetical protein
LVSAAKGCVSFDLGGGDLVQRSLGEKGEKSPEVGKHGSKAASVLDRLEDLRLVDVPDEMAEGDFS